MEPRAAAEPRRLRADAARNRQRLIDAAEKVFAARGLDATLDDIARQAGVNVATAYRHFANKHELAQAFLQHAIEGVIVTATEAAAVPSSRYLAIVLAGLRPDGTPLPGRAPTGAELRAAFADKARAVT